MMKGRFSESISNFIEEKKNKEVNGKNVQDCRNLATRTFDEDLAR